MISESKINQNLVLESLRRKYHDYVLHHWYAFWRPVLKNRTNTTIFIKLLECAKQDVTITKLMHDGYLSYEMTKRYLEVLQKNMLLKYDNDCRAYCITEKGIKFLELAYRLNNLMAHKINSH